MPNRAREIFKPHFKFGLGGVPLGNEFDKHTDKDAQATLEAAWEVGVRYYDVAPWYGLGLEYAAAENAEDVFPITSWIEGKIIRRAGSLHRNLAKGDWTA